MKELQKRKIVEIIFGFFLGRIDLFGINPIGIAFFVICYLEKGAKLSVAVSVLLGMATVFLPEKVLSAMIVMLAIIFAVDILEKQHFNLKMCHIVLLFGGIAGIFTGIRFTVIPHNKFDLYMGIIETILAVVSTRILYDGHYFLLHGKRGQMPGNEETISLTLLFSCVVAGIPNVSIGGVKPLLIVIYFFILTMGYCYGVSGSSTAGVITGWLLVLMGYDTKIAGGMSLLGVIAGMFREQSKLLLCIVYSFVASGMWYYLDSSKFQYMDVLNISVGTGIFLFVPDSFVSKIRLNIGGWDDNFANERLQKLIEYKLNDYSNSINKLSQSLWKKNESDYDYGNSLEIMEKMTTQMCEKCENIGKCDGYMSLLGPEMMQEISAAKEYGKVREEHLPDKFVKECKLKKQFIEGVNYNIHMSNLAMEAENKMLFNQKIIAEQLREVGRIVGNLSKKLPVMKNIPIDMKERIIKELKRKRLSVREIAFYEKFDGRLEIYIKGRTSRGRFVTTREIAKILSEHLGYCIRPREECRKFFPGTEEEIVFDERAKLQAKTEVARRNSKEEEISGDNFSSMTLSEGEVFLALSDGMGCGSRAEEESEEVIDLLEEMTEAGFSQESALRLINAMCIAKEGYSGFATADVTMMNLFDQECMFVKCGASTTYVKQNKQLFSVEGEALPVGVMNDLEPYIEKCSISGGDYVIMMTDGISDSFDDRTELEEIIWDATDRKMSPGEVADEILNAALAKWGQEPQDDMSVMVTKLYVA